MAATNETEKDLNLGENVSTEKISINECDVSQSLDFL